LRLKSWAIGIACLFLFCIAPASALAGTISGTVTDGGGAPQEGFVVCALGSIVNSCAHTGTGGKYTVTQLPAGQYTVEFSRPEGSNFVSQYWDEASKPWDATPIELGESQDVTGINAVAELGGEVRGRVLDADGAPIPGASPCVVAVGSTPEGEYCRGTDENGEYAIHGIPVGAYKLLFYAPSGKAEYALKYYPEKASFEDAETLGVSAGGSVTANTTLAGPGGIEGIVSGKGQPLPGGNVCLYESDGTEVGCAAIGASGGYAFANLAAAAYVLKFESPGFPTQYSGGVSEFAAATPVTVEWEKVAAFDPELRGPSGIRGIVRDAQTGEPIAAGQACAVAESTSVCAQIQGGEYSIPLAPGVYEVRFEAEGHQTQFWDGVLTRSEATPVSVGALEATGIDAELAPVGSIAGQVTTAVDGSGLEGVEVCALAGGGEECSVSRADGTYEIAGLTLGGYKVRFSLAPYVTQYFDGRATAAESEAVTVAAGQVSGGVDATMVKPEIPRNTTPPEVIGVGKAGESLSCTEGTWSDYPPTSSYGYSWSRDGSPIADAETDTYTLKADDAGHSIACGVAATNSLGTAASVQSSNSIGVAAIRELKLFPGGNGFGSVTVSPQGITCAMQCDVDANEGETVTITASPVTHYEFTGWSGGGCTGLGPCEVTLGSTYVLVQASWARITHPVSVTVAGPGSVSASVGAISGCTEAGGTCSGAYEEGGYAFLTATPAPHYELTGWTGCARESAGECWVSTEAAAQATATFAPIVRRLEVATSGNGSGTVTSSPAGIDCGSECSTSALDGETVTLTASPVSHSEFTGWSGGGCTGVGTCEVTLESDPVVTADFTKITHRVSVAVTGSGSVVDSESGRLACGESEGTCSAEYDEGTEVTLTARPDQFHQLIGWTGCTTSSGDECQVTVDAAAQIGVTFAPIVHQLSITKIGTGSGTVTSPVGFTCGPTCALGIDEGTGAFLRAVPDPGSEFTGWSGACTGAGAGCFVPMLQDTSVVADFTAKPSDSGVTGGGGSSGSPVTPGSTSSPVSPTPTSSAPAPTQVTKKPLRCKKGFREVKKKGKARCVRTKAKPKKKGRNG
jgi:Carboxypeptidase regulatory-like domain/Divergent InlB B-repeat domain